MMEIGNGSGLVAVAIGLISFGIIYNVIIAWTERHGYDEGYTAFEVIIGFAGTLGFVALLDWRVALMCLAAFALSGTPMVIGSWWRHVQARKRAQDLLRRGDDGSSSVAQPGG